MKIPVSINNGMQSSRAAQSRILQRDLLAFKKGDWSARNRLTRTFAPLITLRAEKRSSDSSRINQLMEAGREGLLMAARKYRKNMGADRFHIFAVQFIERSMDRTARTWTEEKNGRPSGFFSRLFARRK